MVLKEQTGTPSKSLQWNFSAGTVGETTKCDDLGTHGIEAFKGKMRAAQISSGLLSVGLIGYLKPDWRLSYLRTKDDAEIDLIIERPGMKRAAIEIKSTSRMERITDERTRGFVDLVRSLKNSEGFIFSQDTLERNIDGI